LQSGSGFGIPLHTRGFIHLPAGIPEILNGAIDAVSAEGVKESADAPDIYVTNTVSRCEFADK
jgi:hypothetical protein